MTRFGHDKWWSYLSHFVSQFVFVQRERLFICFCSETPVIYFPRQKCFLCSYYVMHWLTGLSRKGNCHCRSSARNWLEPKWPWYERILGSICVPFYTYTHRSGDFSKSFCLFTEMYSIRFSSDDTKMSFCFPRGDLLSTFWLGGKTFFFSEPGVVQNGTYSQVHKLYETFIMLWRKVALCCCFILPNIFLEKCVLFSLCFFLSFTMCGRMQGKLKKY